MQRSNMIHELIVSCRLELFVNIMALERVVEEHVQAVNVYGTKSLLQLSYAVCNGITSCNESLFGLTAVLCLYNYTGVVPSLESLLHPSLKHIYLHITVLLKLQKQAILEDSGSHLHSRNMVRHLH